ncbi:MAG TPA: cytochrome c3 family protein [Burkholderiales bacterium]|nr:cytochrome c3 family protein [Burkholderiales bacterium]
MMRFVLLLLGALALLPAQVVLTGEAQAQQSEPAKPAEAKPQAERKDKVFAGDARCTRCHDEEDNNILDIAKTRHGGAGPKVGMTCTSCHGESEQHVNKPANATERPKPDFVFGKHAAKDHADPRAGRCLACHGSDRHLAFWESGRHRKNDVACDNCHVIHEARTPQLHKDNPSITPFVTTSRQLQYETCTNCHNPHGALSPAMVREESTNQLCTSCHADKRGPFMNEHPPVEENCLTCHNSHGSIHNKLLSERAPNLCQDCHDASRHPGSFYSGNQGFGSSASGAPNTRLVARACLNCHTNIHGSNAPANRGKFFLR